MQAKQQKMMKRFELNQIKLHTLISLLSKQVCEANRIEW